MARLSSFAEAAILVAKRFAAKWTCIKRRTEVQQRSAMTYAAPDAKLPAPRRDRVIDHSFGHLGAHGSDAMDFYTDKNVVMEPQSSEQLRSRDVFMKRVISAVCLLTA